MIWRKSVRNMDQWFLCSSPGKTQEKDRSDTCSLNRESSCNSSVWYGSACLALLPEYGAKIFSDTFSFLWLWYFFFTLKMGAKHLLWCVHFFPYALEHTFTLKFTKVKVRITISPLASLHVFRLWVNMGRPREVSKEMTRTVNLSHLQMSKICLLLPKAGNLINFCCFPIRFS